VYAAGGVRIVGLNNSAPTRSTPQRENARITGMDRKTIRSYHQRWLLDLSNSPRVASGSSMAQTFETILTCIVRSLEKRFTMHAWQMQEAKARLSEVVKCAQSEGPQNITLHGQSVAVVVSRAMFERLSGNELSLLEFMQRSPLYDSQDIDLERNTSVTREVSL
jgi:prevent-host-death family protein